MDLAQALRICAERHQAVLVTQRRDGRPQLSNIVYALGDDGVVRISVTETRAKTKNLRREPAATLYVPGDSFWAYLVLDGTAELSATATDPHDAVADELCVLYREASGGEHPDWEEFRSVMVQERRLVVHFSPTHAYGNMGG